MIVTINTDASYHKEKKVGSYAFWIVSNLGKICKSGLLKSNPSCPTHAEIKTIANAMHELVNNSKWDGISRVIINTDSMNSIHLLSKNTKAIKKYNINQTRHKNEIELFNKLVGKLKASVELRHVRSHTGKDNKRSWVNEWCDKEAKKELWNFINNQ